MNYGVACSLDGYIAGPNGEYDWIVSDPDIDSDLAAVFARYDTLVMGRGTFEVMVKSGQGEMPGVRICVISSTLKQEDFPYAEIISRDPADLVRELRELPGKNIWIFGGSGLFRHLFEKGLVDGLEIGLMPVLLGGGIPLLPPTLHRAKLKLTAHKVYTSGIVFLEYDLF